MAKRKSAKKPEAKKKLYQKIENMFPCPFCSHPGCKVTLDRERKVGHVECNQCSEDFQTRSHSLTQPIDVYNEWIDACEEANKDL